MTDGVQKPPLVKMGISFVKEMAIWTAAGCPRRNLQEVHEILRTCNNCEHYTKDRMPKPKFCNICGCPIHFRSQKIRWATTKCPLQEPKWVPLDEHTLRSRMITSPKPIKEAIREARVVKKVGGCGGCGKNKTKE